MHIQPSILHLILLVHLYLCKASVCSGRCKKSKPAYRLNPYQPYIMKLEADCNYSQISEKIGKAIKMYASAIQNLDFTLNLKKKAKYTADFNNKPKCKRKVKQALVKRDDKEAANDLKDNYSLHMAQHKLSPIGNIVKDSLPNFLKSLPKNRFFPNLDSGKPKEYGSEEKDKDINTSFKDNLSTIDYFAYYGTLTVGNQKFKVVMDSGSSDLWVIDKSCSSKPCSNKTKFDATKSNTFEKGDKRFKLNYVSGSIEGTINKEIVSLAGSNSDGGESDETGLKLTFGLVDKLPADFINQTYDGILGLSFNPKLNRKDIPLNYLLDKLETKQFFGFSIYLNRIPPFYANHQTTTNEEKLGGSMSLGFINKSKFKPNQGIRWLSLPKSSTRWELKLNTNAGVDVKYSNRDGDEHTESKPVVENLKLQSKTVLLDTGSPVLALPQKELQLIHKAIGAKPDLNNNNMTYSVECTNTNLPTLSFQLETQAKSTEPQSDSDTDSTNYSNAKTVIIELKPEDYIIKDPHQDNSCMSVFVPLPDNLNFWILGSPLFRAYVTAFDLKNLRVGLAQAN